ncbi:MAG: AAA family ATPase [Spirochaetales bacterium]|nr:AAA family ATPase [Spirochaetales bacterium]
MDKTEHAVNLADNYKNVFLSRPRRFGKSLFIDTLHNLFEGKQELFKGLYAHNNWDWSKKYPVIKISWAGDFSSLNSTKDVIASVLRDNQERLGVQCNNTEQYDICFKELIRKTSQKYNSRVVILIDEYDKPILDAIKNPETAEENRNLLRSLYVMMKDSDQYIRFAFLTGVSKFSKASIFSGLNNLIDISLNRKYATVCGYTQNDIETVFKPHLGGVDLDKLRLWYNGYNFLGESVYNPFDILLFISNDFIYRNYWFESGTPNFLMEVIKKNDYFLPNLSNLKV